MLFFFEELSKTACLLPVMEGSGRSRQPTFVNTVTETSCLALQEKKFPLNVSIESTFPRN